MRCNLCVQERNTVGEVKACATCVGDGTAIMATRFPDTYPLARAVEVAPSLANRFIVTESDAPGPASLPPPTPKKTKTITLKKPKKVALKPVKKLAKTKVVVKAKVTKKKPAKK